MDLAKEREIAAELMVLRYGVDGWRCSACGGSRYYQLRTRPKVFQCVVRSCKRQHSITAGTVLERTRTPLARIREAVEHFCTIPGISSRALSREISVGVRTAWQLLHRLRSCLHAPDEPLAGRADTFSRILWFGRPTWRGYAHLVVAADDGERLSVTTGPKEEQVRAALEQRLDLVEEHDPVTCQVRWAHALFNLRFVWTYRQVSELWIARYLQALDFLWRGLRTCYREGIGAVERVTSELVDRALASFMAAPPSTFVSLRPDASLTNSD